MRAVLALLMVLGVLAWVACFVGMLGTESPGARAADGAMLLVGLGGLMLLSFLLWPGRA